MPYSRILLLSLVILSFAYLSYITQYKIASVPGLHYSEAYFGSKAIEINQTGVTSIHGMNVITSSFYPAFVSVFFKYFGVSIYNLRLISVLLNLVGVFLVASFIAIRFSLIQSLLYLLFVNISTYFILYARVAFEVTAFNHFLVSLLTLFFYSFLGKNKDSTFRVFFMYSLIFMGCINHFIFVGIPLAFFITSCVFQSKYSKHEMRIVPLSFWALVIAAGICLLKPCVSDEFFVNNRIAVLIFFLSFPFLGVTFYQISRNRIQNLFWAIREYLLSWAKGSKLRKKASIPVLIISLLSIFCYTPLLIGYLANIYPMMKFFSYRPSSYYQLTGFLFVSILSYSLFKEKKFLSSSFKSRNDVFLKFIVLFTLIYFCSFFITTSRAKVRYLLMFNSFFLLSCSLLIKRYRKLIFLVLVIFSLAYHLARRVIKYFHVILRLIIKCPPYHKLCQCLHICSIKHCVFRSNNDVYFI